MKGTSSQNMLQSAASLLAPEQPPRHSYSLIQYRLTEEGGEEGAQFVCGGLTHESDHDASGIQLCF